MTTLFIIYFLTNILNDKLYLVILYFHIDLSFFFFLLSHLSYDKIRTQNDVILNVFK